MHKAKVTLLFLMFIPCVVFANVYVKIGETKTKYGLDYAYSKLKQMNMKMSYITINRDGKKAYAIFSGPYTTPKTQSVALNNSRIFFKKAKLVKFIKKDISDKESSSSSVMKEQKSSTLSYRKSFFAGLGLGYASSSSSHEIQSGTVTILEPKNDGVSFLIYGGYKFSEKFSFLVNYERVDAQDLVFDNFYATLDYSFYKIGNFSSSLGLSLGGSTLSWEHTPLELASKPSDNDSESLIYGLELKLLYKKYKKLKPFIQYHGMLMEHTTNLTQDIQNSSKLKHNTLHNIVFGLEYKF